MRTLVTGATGHIGSNVVHALAARGHRIGVLVRDPAGLAMTRGIELEVHRGDVLDAASVRAALEGAEVLIHAAAVYRNWTKDPGEMEHVALEGTENVLRAAKDAGVRKVVFTSSCNAVGFTRDLAKLPDETVWNDDPHAPYVRAKVRSERRAHELAKELGLDLVAVLPTGVLGRFDVRVTPTTKNFLDILERRGPIGIPLNLIDVRDVAEGHVLAAEKGRPGERYLLGGENVDVATLASILHDELGVEAQRDLPPGWVLATLSTLAEGVSAITGKEPMLTRAMAEEIRLGKGIVFACGKAQVELGLHPRPAREVVRETARWCGHAKLLTNPALIEKVRKDLPPDPSWPAIG